MPTHTYRASAFLEAARRQGIEVVTGTDRRQALADQAPGTTLAADFRDPEAAARTIVAFARARPLAAIIPTDDDAVTVAAMASAALSLPGNSVESALATLDKRKMREMLRSAGVLSPEFQSFSVDDDPVSLSSRIRYPCVIKPTCLSASRGVIRADDPERFVQAFRRVTAILRMPDVAERGREETRWVLVESFVPGREVALEGLIDRGHLRALSLFDKPDPLDGPFFEETIYLTPSRLPESVQQKIVQCASRGAAALGLTTGAVHAELRVNEAGPWLIEMASRSIGGLCSRALRFEPEASLEELILRQAVGRETDSFRREKPAAGVMMIPIPRAGILEEVRGLEQARAIAGVEDVVISIPPGQQVVPLPEGKRYLGFIFARASHPAEVEAALREAHRRLELVFGAPAEGSSAVSRG